MMLRRTQGKGNSNSQKKGPGGGSDDESQRIVHDRLAGLGYV